MHVTIELTTHVPKGEQFIKKIEFCCANLSMAVINCKPVIDYVYGCQVFTLSSVILKECPFCRKPITIEHR